MRPITLLGMTMLAVVGGFAVLADDQARAHRTSRSSDTANRDATAWNAPPFAEREEEALAFVRRHYPRLATLVEQLKPMRPDEYERAIGELYQVSRTLAGLKKPTDERRYERALEAWKARSKVQVLAAQLASAPSADLEGQLRAAIGHQIDAQVQVQRLEREIIQSRLKKVNEAIERLEKDRDQTIATRFQGLVKKGQRARPSAGGNSAPAPSGVTRKTER